MTEEVDSTSLSGSKNQLCHEQAMFSGPKQLFDYVTSPENTAVWNAASADGPGIPNPDPVSIPKHTEKSLDQLSQIASATEYSQRRIEKLNEWMLDRDGIGLAFRIRRLIESEEAAIKASEDAQRTAGGAKRPLNNPDKGRTAEENREKLPMKLTVDPLAWERLSQIAKTRGVEMGAIVSTLVDTSPRALEILELKKAPARLKSGNRVRKAVRVLPEIIELADKHYKDSGFKSRGAWLSRLVESFVRTAVTESPN